MNRARLYRVGVKRRLALPSLEPRGLQEEEEDNAPQHVSRCFRAFNYLTSVFLARPPCVYKLHTILFVPRCSRFFVSREERGKGERERRDQVVNTNVRLIGRFFEILLENPLVWMIFREDREFCRFLTGRGLVYTIIRAVHFRFYGFW